LGVLENGDVYFNDNILGKFFRKDLPKYEWFINYDRW
jgi:hypothetical protein